MGRASSSKKVARAAGTGGGRTRGGRRPWSYFGVLALVVVLGVVGTWVSRNGRLSQINSAGTVPPTVGTVWNEGFAVDVCGKFLPAIKTTKDPYGLTTSGDGIIHIHPTVKSAAGRNATLGKFASSIGMTLNAASLQVPGGKSYVNGDRCNGKPAQVFVKQFAFVGDKTGVLQTVDPRTVRLQDDAELTIAFVPPSEKQAIPPPPAYVGANLNKLAASSSSSAGSTTTPSTPSTTTPPVSTPSSTAPSSTAPPASTPAKTGTSPAKTSGGAAG